ncbi:hypothetical protein [Clostridium lundense]|uniref:hypothetical protein n=1 Tax=Clostridium lundense TaxID=319475 RepID=UPI00048509DE|nr:hypothetical protein [Clostridium lundense]
MKKLYFSKKIIQLLSLISMLIGVYGLYSNNYMTVFIIFSVILASILRTNTFRKVENENKKIDLIIDRINIIGSIVILSLLAITIMRK